MLLLEQISLHLVLCRLILSIQIALNFLCASPLVLLIRYVVHLLSLKVACIVRGSRVQGMLLLATHYPFVVLNYVRTLALFLWNLVIRQFRPFVYLIRFVLGNTCLNALRIVVGIPIELLLLL